MPETTVPNGSTAPEPAAPPSTTADPGAAEDGPSRAITEVLLGWPEVVAGIGSRGEWSFRVGRREIGHLHGDRVAHFGFPKAVWHRLYDEGRIDYHPVFPGKPGFAQRAIAGEADVLDVIELLRENYDRVTGGRGGVRAPPTGWHRAAAWRRRPSPWAQSARAPLYSASKRSAWSL